MVAKCLWTTPASGDTFRFSIDLTSNYVYFEKIGDLSGYYEESVSNAASLKYGCGFDKFGKLDYSVDPIELGITGDNIYIFIIGNSVISNTYPWTNWAGKTVVEAEVYSYEVTFLPQVSTNRICSGFYNGTKWHHLCIGDVVSYPSQSYSACGVCDCACATCFGPKNTQCDTCASGYYLQPAGSAIKCLETCPNGYYQNTGTYTCTPCATGCATCTGGSNTQCQSCISRYYWHEPTTCSPCATECETCSGGNNDQCSACYSGYFLQPVGSAANCLETCPNGYYQNTAANICSSCSTECTTCTGASSTECLSCSGGYYLVPSSTTCLSCTTGCVSCTSSATCDLCDTGYYILPGSTACVTACPDGLCIYNSNSSCVGKLASQIFFFYLIY
mgnify:CR=1 FL=1